MAELVSAAAMGLAFTELFNVVKDVVRKVVSCRKYCEDLQQDLIKLEPILKEIFNYLGSRPDLVSEEQFLILKSFHQTLEKGKSRLQVNCSRANPLRSFLVSKSILKLRQQVLTHLQQLTALNTLLATRTMETSQQIAASLHDMHQQQNRCQTEIKDTIAFSMQSVREGLDSVQKEMQDALKAYPVAVEKLMRQAEPSTAANDAHQHHEQEQQTSADGLDELFLEGQSLVGLDNQIAEVKKFLCKPTKNDKMVMVLEGMPGIGKTTLALAICRDPQVQGFFGKWVYFFTVSQSPNMKALLSNVWEQVVGGNVPFFQNAEEAQRRLKGQLRQLPVEKRLLVLDDIWSKANMDGLVFEVEGLRTMVTTRQASILNIPHGHTHRLHQLSLKNAEAIFCHYAFQQSSIPPTIEKQLVRNVISECKGLPLALKVIGASLSTAAQSPALWRNALKKLTDAKPLGDYHKDELLGRIVTSIDALDPTLRECFIDLGGYPKGSRLSAGPLLDIWVHVRGMEWVDAISTLVELSHRCLLDLDRRVTSHVFSDFDKKVTSADIVDALESNDADALVIHQHDVMRDLALHLAGKDRLAAKDLLPCQRERIFMRQIGKSVPKDWRSERAFAAQLISITTGDMTEDDWPADLAFPLTEALLLHVIDGSHGYHTPPFIQSMSKLKVLYIGSSTKLTITGPLGASNQLQSFRMENISPSFSILDSLGDVHNLEKLRVKNACTVQELPKNRLGQLTAMKTLDLSKCTSLRCLPETLGQLVALEKLDLTECSGLEDMPESLKDLSNLKELLLGECTNLGSPPESFGQLVALEKLDLWGCDIENLPDSFGHLSNLKELQLGECRFLECLPGTFGQLVDLEMLDLTACSCLKDLPESIKNFSSLNELRLVVCTSLGSLPGSFGQLVALEVLDLWGCCDLEHLPESFGHLSSLKELSLGQCTSLGRLPETFGQLVALEKLDLNGCCGLEDLPESFGHLSSLKELLLAVCTSLGRLPGTFGQLVSLKKLDLWGCSGLEDLPGNCGLLSSLKELLLGECTSLGRLPGTFGQLVSLKELDLSGCSGLEELPVNFGHLSSLKELRLGMCTSLGCLPGTFGQLVALEKLDLSVCSGLEGLPVSFGHLSSLKELLLVDCRSLRSLPGTFGQLVALEKLDLSGCSGLEDLQVSFGHLSSLKELLLVDCRSLRSLPGTSGQLVALQYLDLKGCSGLEHLDLAERFGHLSSLADLQHTLVALENLSLGHSLKLLHNAFGHEYVFGTLARNI